MFLPPVDSPLYQYALLPLAIFCARVIDVSLGTVRVVLLGRGMRLLAPVLGFFEVLVWLLAIGQIMQNLSNWICYVAYAGGFAAGNYVGLWIEARLAMGLSLVRIVTARDASRLKRFLHKAGYRLTAVAAQGAYGPVEVLFTIIRRRHLSRVERVIQRYNPRAFYTVEDVRFASAAGVPAVSRRGEVARARGIIPRRKGK